MIRESEDFRCPEAAFDIEGSPNPWHYEMQETGYNYRASAIHCALGLSQLGKLDRLLAHRRDLATAYDKALAPISHQVTPIPREAKCNGAWHVYVIQINWNTLSVSRSRLIDRLHQSGFGSQVHYRPVHLQPKHRESGGTTQLPVRVQIIQNVWRCLCT